MEAGYVEVMNQRERRDKGGTSLCSDADCRANILSAGCVASIYSTALL